MRRPSLPFLLAVTVLVTGAALIFAGCKNLSGTSDSEGTTTTTTEQVAATTSTIPQVTATTVHVTTTEEPVLTTQRYEENNPKLQWTGSWTFTGGADDSGGSCVYTEDNGASVTLKFTGVSVSLVTRVGLALGKIQVTLDSGTPDTIDCYSGTPGYQQIIWAADPIPNATHYLKLECTGTSNPASGGTGIYIDAFAITGTLDEQ